MAPPIPNGHAPPTTLETLDVRLHALEYTYGEDMKAMRPVLIEMGGEQKRQGMLLALVADAVGVKPDAAGPPPDVTGALKALAARDAELAARDAELEKRVGAAADLVPTLKVIAGWSAKIAGGLIGLTAAIWGGVEMIGALVKAFGGGGP